MLENNKEFLTELYKKCLTGNMWRNLSKDDFNKLYSYNIDQIFINIFSFNENFSFKVLTKLRKSWEHYSEEDLITILNKLKNDIEIRCFLLFLEWILSKNALSFFDKNWKGNKKVKRTVLKGFEIENNLLKLGSYYREAYGVGIIVLPTQIDI